MNEEKAGLKLTRRIGEKTLITTSDGPIIIEVISRRGNSLLYKFIAPESVRIHRMDQYFYDKANTVED